MSVSNSNMSSRTSSLSRYPYLQEAIRVQAQHLVDKEEPTFRRFSIDPQLTNFDILRNIIGRAFDMKGDFAINYRAFDDFGGEAYLPMVSDWDLSAAFYSASDPDLQLIVESKNIPLNMENGSYSDEPWEIIKSSEVIQSSPFSNLQNRNIPNSGQQRSGQQDIDSSKLFQQNYPINLNAKINTTGIFNTVQKAKTFVEDISVVTTRPPLSDVEFRNFLDSAGVLCRPRELRYACYHGGVENSLRKVAWKHLLNVYPEGLSGSGRIEYIRNKSKEYYELRDIWKVAMQNGQVCEEVLAISCMVRKDVLRTDRHLKFFSGHDDNQNLANLFNILTTYSLNHPKIGYCQGMSDLASPLLVIMGDEAQAYICLCSLMDRLKPNFYPDGLAMSLKFTHLAEALTYYDAYYWDYLKSVGADDLLFAYRWLLLELKREFAFEDSLKMFEVLWSTLPSTPKDVQLYEVKFTGSSLTSTIPIGLPAMTSSYSKVCAIRRTNSNTNELRNRRFSKTKSKANPNLSLDENSITSLSSSSPNSSFKSVESKPYYSLDDTMEILSLSDFQSSSFEIISQSGNNFVTVNKAKPRKLVRNLKEFWDIGRDRKSLSKSNSCDESVSSSASSPTKSIGNEFTTTNNNQHNMEQSMNKSNFYLKRSSSVDLSSNSTTNNHILHDDLCKENNDVFYIDSKVPTTTHDGSLYSDTTLTHDGDTLESSIMKHQNQNNTEKDQVSINNNISTTKDDRGEINNKEHATTVTTNTNTRCGSTSEVADSENDSGHQSHYGESIDLEYGNSINEPEFTTGSTTRRPSKIPCPEDFGGGNPFLMFLSLTLLLQHRDHIINNNLEYNEIGMFYDKMIRKHNLNRVLGQARQMYSNYLKQSIPRA